MTLALWLQWGLLAVNAAVLLAAAAVGWRRRPARPVAFAVGVLTGAHLIYYVMFLVLPDVLDATATMLLSISLRYMVVFLAAFMLAIGAGSRPWKR